MTSITDLLNKNKPSVKEQPQNGQNSQVKNKPKFQIRKTLGANNSASANSGKRNASGIKLRTPAHIPDKTNETTGNQIHMDKQNNPPLAQLAKTLADSQLGGSFSIKTILDDTSMALEKIPPPSDAENQKTPEPTNEGHSERGGGFHNPTLEDVSKFVFDEQPDDSTEEIADKFSDMLDNLNTAVGDEVPSNLAKCLQFMKEHSFLADILKPENIGELVTAMRKSYGFIVQHKTEKQSKTSKRAAKQNDIMDSLGDLDFSL